MINSTSNSGLISIDQVISLIAVNIIGLVGIGLIFYLMREKTPNPRTKLIMSVKMGLIMITLLAVVSIDLGISFWIKSGNFQTMVLALPLILFGGPFAFFIVVIGTYIQLIYRDKIQKYVDSHKRQS